MKQSFTRVLILSLSFLACGLFFPKSVNAQLDNDSIPSVCSISIGGAPLSTNSSAATSVRPLRVEGTTMVYEIQVCGDLSLRPAGAPARASIAIGRTSFRGQIPVNTDLSESNGCLVGEIRTDRVSQSLGPQLSVIDVETTDMIPFCQRVFANFLPETDANVQAWNTASSALCSSVEIDPPNPVHNTNVTVSYTVPDAYASRIVFPPDSGSARVIRYRLTNLTDGTELALADVSGASGAQSQTHASLQASTYRVDFTLDFGGGGGSTVTESGEVLCSRTFTVGTPESPGGINEETTGDGVFNVCTQTGVPGSQSFQDCENCFRQEQGVWTGVGCIPFYDPAETIRSFITIGMGISGGVVVLMTLAGSFLLSTSQGEPKRVDEAKSLITSAVAGILFIIFSVTILRFIGVNIFRLPAFG